MASVYDTSYPVYEIPPMGLNPGPSDILPLTIPYWPQPQPPVSNQLPARYYIDTRTPNPFSIKPIDTQWHSNELIMDDPVLRTAARVSMEDIGMKQASNYVSPQHLNLGWKWCGGYPGCEINDGPVDVLKATKQAQYVRPLTRAPLPAGSYIRTKITT